MTENTLLQNSIPALTSALKTFRAERSGILALEEAMSEASAGGLAHNFAEVVGAIHGLKGRVVVTGMGKSGHIARKLAATFASTGTPAFFVHPAEASHGDMGMIQEGDAILALSWSGETAELADVITFSRRFDLLLIAITSNPEGTLAKEADYRLLLPRAEEACPNGLAPTTSTTMQLVMGDALAVALLEARGFSARDFKIFHPGGKLGAKLVLVRDIMHKGDQMPVVTLAASMAHAVIQMTEKRLGCVLVENAAGELAGIITDGDLRRKVNLADLLSLAAESLMSRSPTTIAADSLAAEALQVLESRKISVLAVVDAAGKPVGVVHIHDLLRLGVA
eukprot:gene7596-7658_t